MCWLNRWVKRKRCLLKVIWDQVDANDNSYSVAWCKVSEVVLTSLGVTLPHAPAKDAFLSVEAVFCFVENHRLRAIHH